MAQQTAAIGTLPRRPAAPSGSSGSVPVVADPLLSLRYTKPRSLWGDAWRRLIKNRMAVVGMVTIVLFWLLALLAPLVAPHGLNEQNHTSTYLGPAWATGNWTYPLGTDGVGRDELSRLLWGARISMVVGIIPVCIYLVVGGTVGMIAGYFGGRR